jgi:hypothetical protein
VFSGTQSAKLMSEHGTRSRYTLGCRCSLCTASNTLYMRRYWQQRREASRESYLDGPAGVLDVLLRLQTRQSPPKGA